MKYISGYSNGIWIVGEATKYGTINRSIKDFYTAEEAENFANKLNQEV